MFFCSYVVNIKTPIFVSTKKLYGTRNTTQRPQQTGVSSYAYGRAYTESDYDSAVNVRKIRISNEKNQNAIIFYPSSQLRK